MHSYGRNIEVELASDLHACWSKCLKQIHLSFLLMLQNCKKIRHVSCIKLISKVYNYP